MPTRKRKAVKRKKKTVKPKKVTVSVTRKTTIGKARSPAKTSAYYLKAARDKLYNEMGGLMIQKEKAKTKRAKKKIGKKISLKRSQINKLK